MRPTHRLILYGAVLVLGVLAVRMTGSAVLGLRYPYLLDYGEGTIVTHTEALAAGEPLYPSLDGPPWWIGNYPPLGYVPLLGLRALTGDTLLAGRLVSLLATWMAALGIGALVFMALGVGPQGAHLGRRDRLLGALAAGGAYLAMPHVVSWSWIVTMDLPALALALGGAWVLLALGPSRWRDPVGAALLLAAFLTKQTIVCVAAAAVLAVLHADRRRGLRLLALGGLGAGLAVAAVELWSDGRFLAQTLRGNAHPIDGPKLARQLLLFLLLEGGAVVVVAAGAVLAPVRWARRGLRAADSTGAAPPARLPSTAVFLGIWIALGLLRGITTGKVGANHNHLLELAAGLAAAAGLLAARPLAGIADPPRHAGALLLPLLLVGHGLWVSPQLFNLAHPPSTLGRRVAEAQLELMRRTEGPVLAVDLVLLHRAGRPVEYEHFSMMQLAYHGLWDQAPLLERLRAGHYALVLIDYDQLDATRGRESTPEFRETLATHYVAIHTWGRVQAYVPRRTRPDAGGTQPKAPPLLPAPFKEPRAAS